MATQASKASKVWKSVFSGVNIQAPAKYAANILTDNAGAMAMLRATASEALLAVGRACAKSGDIESVNHAAHWYAEQRMEDGIKEATASKEASQLRAVCRACFGGVKVQKKLEENGTLYTHEFAALARKITPKAYAKKSSGGGGHEKSAVTDKEFQKMRQWLRLLSAKQRAVVDAILVKVDAEAKQAATSDKVTDIKSARKLKRAA